MTDTLTAGPLLTNTDFHPDHPGPLGWLIYALHVRMQEIEAKLKITPATLAQAESKVSGVVATVETDVMAAVHKIEDVLHIPHGS